MVALEKSFNSFADSFDIPKESRPHLLSVYIGTYNYAVAKVNLDGEESKKRRSKIEVKRQATLNGEAT